MNQKTRFVVQAGIIAALYVVLVEVFAPISFGLIQFRIAECLTILPFFTPAAIPGLFIGCLASNFLYQNILIDMVLGSLATLTAALLSYLLRKNKWLVPIPPVVVNAIVVPFVLKYGYGVEGTLLIFAGAVFLGQLVTAYGLGMVLLHGLLPVRNKIFNNHK